MGTEDTSAFMENTGYLQVFEEGHVWRRVLTIDSPEGRPILAIERKVPAPVKVGESLVFSADELINEILVQRNATANHTQQHNKDTLEELCW